MSQMWYRGIFFLCLAFSVYGEEKELPHVPPDQKVILQEMRQAEMDFAVAQKMFNPWYAGPLLTGSASNVPPGHFNFQSYLFASATYGIFNQHRHVESIPTIVSLHPICMFQMGWFDWLDFSTQFSAFCNTQSGNTSSYIGDTVCSFGIPILLETSYQPAVRFLVSAIFPTGRFDNLHPKNQGIDGTGSGVYAIEGSLNMSKILWWFLSHPMRIRLSLNYTVMGMSSVRGWTVYGGGRGTRGHIHPGNTIEIDSSIELSLSQKWVLTTDFSYVYQNHTTFSGKRGVGLNGQVASIGLPSSDRFSLAPAIVYLPKHSLGIVIGGEMTITGRNIPSVVSGIVSVTYYW